MPRIPFFRISSRRGKTVPCARYDKFLNVYRDTLLKRKNGSSESREILIRRTDGKQAECRGMNRTATSLPGKNSRGTATMNPIRQEFLSFSAPYNYIGLSRTRNAPSRLTNMGIISGFAFVALRSSSASRRIRADDNVPTQRRASRRRSLIANPRIIARMHSRTFEMKKRRGRIAVRAIAVRGLGASESRRTRGVHLSFSSRAHRFRLRVWK